MTDAWMPGAERVPAAADGGCLKGGVPRAVWLVLPGDPVRATARESAESLARLGRPCHLVWNPLTGDVAQLIPVTRAARALGWPSSPRRLACSRAGEPLAPAARDGLPGVNNEGRVCAQIGVIGQPGAPCISGSVPGLDEILNWLDSWRVPHGGPACRPPQAPAGRAPQSRRDWARGGHFRVSQVPGCPCAGPAAIDGGRLTGAQLPAGWPPAAAPGGMPGGTGGGSAAPGGPFREPARILAMTRQPRRTPARSAAP